ncbi:carbohydrate kinase, partial [Halorubrum sp. SD626R]|uniref:PfkB family carbohydrate kinase n=1 Tax=Halorubrum sp. SD626R TaxID=1419722 RepID=UPI00113C384E
MNGEDERGNESDGGGNDWDAEVAEWDEEVAEWETDSDGSVGDAGSTDGDETVGDTGSTEGSDQHPTGDPDHRAADEPEPAADPDLEPESADRVPKVVSAGHINWDVTIHVDQLPEPDGETRIERLEQSGGGSAANVAVGLVGLGGQSVVYGSVGGDESGALALRELASAGVDPGQVLVAADEPTSVKY